MTPPLYCATLCTTRSRRHGRVHAITTYEPPEGWSWAFGLDLHPELDAIGEAARVQAQAVVDGVLADLPGDLAGVGLDLDVVAGRPGDVLVDASREADMLVVGHRGRGLLRSAALGSVGLNCVLHATCPVTVVPPAHDGPGAAAGGRATVVVGVDGSEGSREALQHAVRDADRRGDTVLAIAAYDPPELWGLWWYGLSKVPDRQEIEHEQLAGARRFVDETVTSKRPGLRDEPKVDVEVRPGSAAEVLTSASRGADALHVGHRGRGAFGSAALGSVGLGCVVRASCPVTVVPAAHVPAAHVPAAHGADAVEGASVQGEPAADIRRRREGEPPGEQAADNELAYEGHPRLPGRREGEPVGEQARDQVRASEQRRRRDL